MSFDCQFHARIGIIVGALLLSACASTAHDPDRVALRSGALELDCAAAAADMTGDVTAVLSSVAAFDASQPQAYGSENCGGFVFELDNAEEEPLHGAWVQASGKSSSSADLLSESHCSERLLETDYWGWKDREWVKLASASGAASFDPSTSNCDLETLIESPGTFEKLRIVARVTQGSHTYPMHACVW
ncbi:MAG TPA: hypothetical protein VGP15_21845 [Burkholderiales bacterium]|nr:hypothetical protein [Burkholderiales bacterium]